jgi:hypothetical protein
LDAHNPQPEPKECFDFAKVQQRGAILPVLPAYFAEEYEFIRRFDKVGCCEESTFCN